jgi:hypothetical protein
MSSVDRPIVTVLPGGTTGTGSKSREIPDSKVKIAVPMTLSSDGGVWAADADTAANCAVLPGDAAAAAAGRSAAVDVPSKGTRVAGAGAAIRAAADGASGPPAARSASRLKEPTPIAATGFVGATSKPAAEARWVGFADKAADSGPVASVVSGVSGDRLVVAAMLVTDGVGSVTDGDPAASSNGLAAAGPGVVAVVMRPVGIRVVVVGGAGAGRMASAGFAASVADRVPAMVAGSDGPLGRDGLVPVVYWR